MTRSARHPSDGEPEGGLSVGALGMLFSSSASTWGGSLRRARCNLQDAPLSLRRIIDTPPLSRKVITRRPHRA
ncbi:hypothetical protein O9K51_03858 [Purpureocillium lavendulum]|uniref:Uncharacterized protein n=1 Tax=Purpureocillium lavendulum TaxID=1247861 RepID=A0AB34FV55_9HYPO|nr:hypothetical protein O9K51_03858 [Purpureocillium lavendulum]